MFGLGHVDIGPSLYIGLMFLGIWSIWRKLLSRQLLRIVIEIAVFALVFKLHHGTLGGGFSAMACALLAGILVRRWRKPGRARSAKPAAPDLLHPR